MSPSSDDDKSSDKNEDDGIDLFASEESESENEGRFKSNSSKNVKPKTVATLSFSKLGRTTTSTLGDLNEVKADKNSTSSHRDDKYKRSANYTNRKEDRNRKYGNGRNDDRYGEAGNNYKSRYPSSAASVVPKVVDEKKKDDKLMFKSTFQVLPNELKSEAVKSTTKTVSSRISPVKEKPGDKKLIVLKRPAEPIIEEQVEEESAPVYQFLPPRDGYVPVYIRLGDTPLEEINPDLALAFHESNIETRNANDLEEQMLNDAPANDDDLSESVEDVKKSEVVAKNSNSGEEEQKSEASVKLSDDEADSEEKPEPQKNSPVANAKSQEETESEEEPALTKLTKENDSDEIVSTTSTNKPKPTVSEDNSSEESTKSKRSVTPKVDDSSEENDDKVTEQQASTSNESKSSEEVVIQS